MLTIPNRVYGSGHNYTNPSEIGSIDMYGELREVTCVHRCRHTREVSGKIVIAIVIAGFQACKLVFDMGAGATLNTFYFLSVFIPNLEDICEKLNTKQRLGCAELNGTALRREVIRERKQDSQFGLIRHSIKF